jgi:hypothetical protein
MHRHADPSKAVASLRGITPGASIPKYTREHMILMWP